jgi:SAM-dependent methyltransferase
MIRRSKPEHYFRLGLEALQFVQLAVVAAGASAPKRILDLPCGHGRVLRMLRAAYPEADISACDIDRDAVNFSATTFGAVPIYSTEDPGEVPLTGTFDVIWCGSLLTHLNAESWHGFLTLFEERLSTGGIMVFTTRGSLVAEEMRTSRRDFGLERSGRSLLEGYDQAGFGFDKSNAQYGLSLASPGWVCRELERYRSLRLIAYIESAWGGRQDVVGLTRRRPGH